MSRRTARGRTGALARAAALVLGLGLVAGACAPAAPETSPTPTGPATSGSTIGPSTSQPSTATSGVSTPTPGQSTTAPGQSTPPPTPSATPVDPVDALVQSALDALPDDEARVGQLLMLGWEGGNARSARATIETLHPGALVFIQNTHSAAQATRITAGIRDLAHETGTLPPLITIDHEGGIVQRITDVPNFGSNRAFALTFPTTRDACLRGRAHLEQLHAMGFSMDLAPVLDVNTNPDNPVIGDRSYGADPKLVARLGAAYVRGMQAGGRGIVAVGKHFPGHGDTSVDSHLGLPILPFDMERLERVELVPFRRAIEDDTRIGAIMVAHIALPQLDHSGRPASLSKPIVTGLLRDQLGFDGLVLTDDLAAMQAITDRYGPGEAAVDAIAAGVDMLILGGDLKHQTTARDALLDALGSGELTRDRLDDALRHVLTAKARFGVLDGHTLDPLPPADCDD